MPTGGSWNQKNVPAVVKDPDLVEARRLQIIQAAVRLFVRQGFHRTTIRQIARAAEISIGSLYEYVAAKEDILYLVCDHIHASVEGRLRASIQKAQTGRQALVQAVRAYFAVCDDLSDDILLIYQESNSLTPEARRFVLGNEARITGLFEEILRQGAEDGSLDLEGPAAVSLLAHDIAVLGHMWTFRRWYLEEHYSLEEYTRLQTQLLLSGTGSSRDTV